MTLESLHDLRQPLTAIQNFTRACINELHRHPEDVGKLFGWLESAHQQAKRASEMLKESKAQGPCVNCPPGPIDIKRCIKKILERLKRENSIPTCVLNARSDERLYFLLGDNELLEAVLRDLFVTAVGSILRSDNITQNLNVDIDRENADLVLEIREGAPVCDPTLSVDSGGVEEHECLARTLGLTVCEAIIERHGGSLILWRRQDGAVRVRARLPAYQQHEGFA